MNVSQFRISRRSVALVAASIGMVSLAIGAHAALNKRALDAAKAIGTEQPDDAGKQSKLALVIGNGHYPDAAQPLTSRSTMRARSPRRCARAALTSTWWKMPTSDDMQRAIGRLKSKIKPDSVVMLFFGGYGIQAGRESYMIPVDARIWKEGDVRREGISVESVLDGIKEKGAHAKLVVIDASRRNPYERRFRSYSHGLAPINSPDNALIISSATPGKVADDSKGQNSVLVTELLNNLAAKSSGIESVFKKTRVAISRASDGEQVPTVSSSLLDDIRFGG